MDIGEIIEIGEIKQDELPMNAPQETPQVEVPELVPVGVPQ